MTTVLLFTLFACQQEYDFYAVPQDVTPPWAAVPRIPTPPTPPTPPEPPTPLVASAQTIDGAEMLAPFEAWYAEAPVYAHTRNVLFEVDPWDGQTLRIGRFTDAEGPVPNGAYDLAIDADGRMFVGFSDGSIHQVDPATARVTPHCQIELAPTGMTFTPQGTLLIAGLTYDGAARLLALDLRTCIGMAVLEDSPYVTSGDLVDHPDGFLYWTVRSSGSSDRLVRVDPVTWELEVLGRVGYDVLFGLGYAEGELIAFSADGETLAIEPVAAAAGEDVPSTLLRSDAGRAWWGATTNPVTWD